MAAVVLQLTAPLRRLLERERIFRQEERELALVLLPQLEEPPRR